MDYERSSCTVTPEGVMYTIAGLTDEERALAVSAATAASEIMDVQREHYRTQGAFAEADHLEGMRVHYSDVAEHTRAEDVPTYTVDEFNLLCTALSQPAQLRRSTMPVGHECDELESQVAASNTLAKSLMRLLTDYERSRLED